MRPLACLASVVLASAVLTLPACERETSDESSSSIVVDTYVVRGRVVSLPQEGNPASQLMVHHEEIPHFRGQGGDLGMNEMTMPFPIGESLDLTGIEAGMGVRITFTVDYDEALDQLVTYRATSIEAVPEGEPLGLTTD